MHAFNPYVANSTGMPLHRKKMNLYHYLNTTLLSWLQTSLRDLGVAITGVICNEVSCCLIIPG